MSAIQQFLTIVAAHINRLMTSSAPVLVRMGLTVQARLAMLVVIVLIAVMKAAQQFFAPAPAGA